MKFSTLLSISLLLLSSAAFAADDASTTKVAEPPEEEVNLEPNKGNADTGTSPQTVGVENFCFFSGSPPDDEKYMPVKRLKIGKGTYGSVKDILPKLANHARQLGADAIMNYTGSQRFGFLPWRMVRPVVQGLAIKWVDTKNRDCAAMGGTTMERILSTDRPPAQ